MALFLFIGLILALAGVLYGQWLFLVLWGVIAITRFVHEMGKQAGLRQAVEEATQGQQNLEYIASQREAAKEGRQ